MATDLPTGVSGAQPIQVAPDALMQAANSISGLADAVRAERAKLQQSHDVAVQGWVEPISRNAYDHWFGAADEQLGQRETELHELATPPYYGQYVIDFHRPVGRVFHQNGPVETDVTRVLVVRAKDGTLTSAYPVTKGYTLKPQPGRRLTP